MKKVAILLENYFDEHEFIYPYHRLREEFEVDIIGTEAKTEHHGKSSFTVVSDKASADVSADDYEAVYIPGGYSPDGMRGCEATVKFIREMHEKGKLIAAICHGPWLLADAIDLDGVKMTCVPKIKNDFIHAGADWVDEEVVVDGNIITSRTPADLPAQLKKFTELILEK